MLKQAKYNLIYYGAWNFLTIISLSIVILSSVFFNLLILVLSLTALIFCCINYVPPLIRTIRRLKSVYYSQFEIVRPQEYTICKFGKARSGKTFSAVLEAVILAELKWSKLCKEYVVMSKRVLLAKNKYNEEFQRRFNEVSNAYNYWISHPEYIACLLSNVKIRKGEQYSADLTREHFRQEYWCPSFCVWLVDEIGRFFKLEESSVKDKPYREIDQVCFTGQYIETNILMTEQRPDNFPIDFKGVTGVFESVLSLHKTYLAITALNILEKLENKYIKRKAHPDKFERLYNLRKWFDQVGFFEFTFETQGNIVYGNQAPKVRKVIVFKNLDFKYESRAYQDLYLAKDKDPYEGSSNNMYIQEDSLIAKTMFERYKIQDEREEEKKHGKKKAEKRY